MDKQLVSLHRGSRWAKTSMQDGSHDSRLGFPVPTPRRQGCLLHQRDHIHGQHMESHCHCGNALGGHGPHCERSIQGHVRAHRDDGRHGSILVGLSGKRQRKWRSYHTRKRVWDCSIRGLGFMGQRVIFPSLRWNGNPIRPNREVAVGAVVLEARIESSGRHSRNPHRWVRP